MEENDGLRESVHGDKHALPITNYDGRTEGMWRTTLVSVTTDSRQQRNQLLMTALGRRTRMSHSSMGVVHAEDKYGIIQCLGCGETRRRVQAKHPSDLHPQSTKGTRGSRSQSKMRGVREESLLSDEADNRDMKGPC